MMFQRPARPTRPKPGADRLAPTMRYSALSKDFSYSELSKLQELRRLLISGNMTEWPADRKRLLFARHLYLNGLIEG